jgi:hypothetical protein
MRFATCAYDVRILYMRGVRWLWWPFRDTLDESAFSHPLPTVFWRDKRFFNYLYTYFNDHLPVAQPATKSPLPLCMRVRYLRSFGRCTFRHDCQSRSRPIYSSNYWNRNNRVMTWHPKANHMEWKNKKVLPYARGW